MCDVDSESVPMRLSDKKEEDKDGQSLININKKKMEEVSTEKIKVKSE
jgi:hypothetical protein